MSSEPIMLVGIEEEGLYEKNRALFLAHLKEDPEIQEKLQVYGRTLENSERSLWGADLLAFGSAWGKFRETTDLGNFFPVLLKTAEAQGAETADLAQSMLLRDIMALE